MKTALFIGVLLLNMSVLQFVIDSVLQRDVGENAGHLRREESDVSHKQAQMDSYDVLLKNSISYETVPDNTTISSLQESIHNLQSQIISLESKAKKYADDPLFFPFVIRDSRHLTPVQIDPDFHVFDYVDLTQAKQPRSKHSVLMHNSRIVVDEVLEAQRAREPVNRRKERYAEKHEAPCQKYSIECYAQKILQVFSYVLRKFPSVEYYFYVEADNSLCVPMTMVRDLALNEQRYFINTGIGFSGWIMSRKFLGDFIELYENKTRATLEKAKKKSKVEASSVRTKNATAGPEIRPDVLASYYLTDRHAWAVTRQYWVSHTTLESLGIASLSVKDRRKDETGERMKLDKHLPRCLEPRRGKWKVSRRRPYLDPRDRFGWDYFDYEVCPDDQVLFPCGGPDQLKELVANDWRIANETGALARWKELEKKKREKEENNDNNEAGQIAQKGKDQSTQKETAENAKQHALANARNDARKRNVSPEIEEHQRKAWKRWKKNDGPGDNP